MLTVALLAALAVLGLGTIALRSFLFERASFHPPRGPAPRPVASELAALRDATFGNGLRGWYLPSRNGAAVVLLHGSSGDRRDLLEEARCLARCGYGALLFDSPGHGESEGRVAWGAAECVALSAAVGWVTAQPEVTSGRVGVFGFSSGAAIAAQVAAADPRVRAAVLASVFADGDEQTRHSFRRWGPLSTLPALLADRLSGPNLRPLDSIGSVRKPLLFIVGSEDDVVPRRMSERVFEAAPGPKELWIVPGAGHGGYAKARPEYGQKLCGFFDEALR